MVHNQKVWHSYLVIFLILGLGVYGALYRNALTKTNTIAYIGPINSYGECVDAGIVPKENTFRTCSFGGRVFAEGITYDDKSMSSPPEAIVKGVVEHFQCTSYADDLCMINGVHAQARLYNNTGLTVLERAEFAPDGSYFFAVPEGDYFIDIYPHTQDTFQRKKAVVKKGDSVQVDFDYTLN